jgi:hypothetical protein
MKQIFSDSIDFCRTHGFSFVPESVKKKKHPRIGWRKYQNIFPTDEEIESWRNDPHNTGIFILTGKLSNLVVVDLDKPKDLEEPDDEWISRMIAEYNLPPTYTVKTGGG